MQDCVVMALKLYVWRGDGVLEDYTSGIAFTLADNASQARDLLRGSLKEDVCDESMQFLDREPEVFDSPVALWVHGGG